MTIKVTKPEIKLIEKLNELDFETLPHGKMPIGSIIQYASNTSSANSISTSSTSFVDSGHDILFTPHYANSKIIVKLQSRRFNLVSSDVIELKIMRDDTVNIGYKNNVTDGTIHFQDADSSASNQIAIGLNYNWEDSPNTTAQVKYTPFFKVNTGTGYLADSGGLQFYVYEIKQ